MIFVVKIMERGSLLAQNVCDLETPKFLQNIRSHKFRTVVEICYLELVKTVSFNKIVIEFGALEAKLSLNCEP